MFNKKMHSFKFSPLLHKSRKPLYRQLADQIREGIRMKMFEPDEPLPKEIDIANTLGISRSVVRQAILQLVSEGLLYRVPRKGTFLATPSIEYDLLGFYNFKDEVEKQGHELSVRLISFQKIPMDPINSNLFRVSEGEQLVEIWRTLLVNKFPVLIERTTLPESFVPGISAEDIRDYPYSSIFRKFGLKFSKAKKYIEPQLADPFISRNIDISHGMPVLVVDRFTFDTNDNVVARCEWTIRGDRCRHFIKLDTLNI